MIPFIKYSKIWLAISGLVALVCIVFLFMWQLKLGIDFTGGSLMQVSFSQNTPPMEDLQKSLEAMGLHNSVIQTVGDKGVLFRTNFLSEDEHQNVLKTLRTEYQKEGNTLTEVSFETIGSSVSQQLRSRAVWAIIFVNIGIILYVAYAFRKVSRPVASWKYGLLAIVALLHDVLLVMGVFALLGHLQGVEIDVAFVVAILTVLGYSVNDTIVVYDRIRENLIRKSSADFAETVNTGLNETLMRSINTTLKTMLPLFALYFLGGSTLHNFTLALLIGIASGAYSSIFIASPLLVIVHKWQLRRQVA
ncbi:MAG: protein translocase subunit SecF [Patescibacteria group bacterium]